MWAQKSVCSVHIELQVTKIGTSGILYLQITRAMQTCHCLSNFLLQTGLPLLNHGLSLWFTTMSNSAVSKLLPQHYIQWYLVNNMVWGASVHICLHSAYKSEEPHSLHPFHDTVLFNVEHEHHVLDHCWYNRILTISLHKGSSLQDSCDMRNPDCLQCFILLNFLWHIELHCGIGLIDS